MPLCTNLAGFQRKAPHPLAGFGRVWPVLGNHRSPVGRIWPGLTGFRRPSGHSLTTCLDSSHAQYLFRSPSTRKRAFVYFARAKYARFGIVSCLPISPQLDSAQRVAAPRAARDHAAFSYSLNESQMLISAPSRHFTRRRLRDSTCPNWTARFFYFFWAPPSRSKPPAVFFIFFEFSFLVSPCPSTLAHAPGNRSLPQAPNAANPRRNRARCRAPRPHPLL